MEANEQIAKIKATCTSFKQVSAREVIGGFVVAGNTQWQDNDTKGMVLSENAEGVAASASQAAQYCLNYLNTGTFNGIVPDTAQPNMFSAGGTVAIPSTAPASI